MKFKQFYLGCLAHASYYIGSETEAAIIDPQRDVEQYLTEAAANDQKIKYIIETHSHADFVSGHIELAEKTGAKIIYGERANTQFPTHKVKDGDELHVGKVKLKFFETPGHTPEGITILAENTENPSEPLKMFTGDTLFIGDVGRPDLIGSKGFTAEEMGAMLYDSLREKILPLPDETEVYPAHGAGSLCGKSLSKETWSTLGNQRKMNYALQPMTKEEFIKIVAADQPEVPAYFPKSAAKNLEGSAALEALPKPKPLSTEEIENFDGVVLDVRQNTEFGASHIPNAINIGLGGQFASWTGTLVAIGTPIAIAADTQEQVDEAFMRLARVGHETVKGFILMKDFAGQTNEIEQVSVGEVKSLTETEKYLQFVDVRRPAEHAGGHAPRTLNISLDKLSKEIDRLDPLAPTYVICQSGYRSSLGTGILENAGFKKVYNVTGGTQAWINAGFETEVSATTCATSK
ncbi:MAG TPA: rhodanese-like domain-containing protein [Pyrinomonadaceae bacterium]|nr:rhodanese-like domain-containing protein [Pyrinomonadaceae bacterium]